jgi:hypothetical protein
MRGTLLLGLAVLAAFAAGCAGISEESVDGTCGDVGDEYSKGGMEGEHCPNETPLTESAQSA